MRQRTLEMLQRQDPHRPIFERGGSQINTYGIRDHTCCIQVHEDAPVFVAPARSGLYFDSHRPPATQPYEIHLTSGRSPPVVYLATGIVKGLEVLAALSQVRLLIRLPSSLRKSPPSGADCGSYVASGVCTIKCYRL